MTAMPLTPTAGSRYIPPGVRQYYWVETVADKSAPTRTELDAGTDLSAEMASVDGFTVTSDTVDAPDLASRFTSKVAGMTTADDSSINLYLSSNGGSDARTALPRDSAGFVVVFPEGDDDGADGHTMDVFPSTVTANSVQPDMDAPGQTAVAFAITSEPVQNVPVPSSV